MKATGIVRRIDDLGRVVIPKEIRRTMRIREGTPLEIYTDRDGEVIFKKYSPVGEMSDQVGVYAEIISKAVNNTVAIVDKDTVVAVSGARRKDMAEKKISEEAERCLRRRETYVYKIGDRRISVINGVENCYAGIIRPIISDSDIAGAFIMLVQENGAAPAETDVKLINTAAQLLERQMDG